MKNDTTSVTAGNPFGDIGKIMMQFELPGVDLSRIVEARRKDVEALVEANRSAWESVQAFGAKQTEMIEHTLQGIQEASMGAARNAVANDTAKQTEIVRNACDRALADMQELAAIAVKAQTDAMAHLQQRAAEQMEEFRALMTPR